MDNRTKIILAFYVLAPIVGLAIALNIDGPLPNPYIICNVCGKPRSYEETYIEANEKDSQMCRSCYKVLKYMDRLPEEIWVDGQGGGEVGEYHKAFQGRKYPPQFRKGENWDRYKQRMGYRR